MSNTPVTGFSWAGVRTDEFTATVEFFARTFGVSPEVVDDDRHFAMFRLPTGQQFEVFGPRLAARGFITAPIIGFDVADVGLKRSEMERVGVEFVTPVFDYGDGVTSSYFRGPDGHLYEIWHRPETLRT